MFRWFYTILEIQREYRTFLRNDSKPNLNFIITLPGTLPLYFDLLPASASCLCVLHLHPASASCFFLCVQNLRRTRTWSAIDIVLWSFSSDLQPRIRQLEMRKANNMQKHEQLHVPYESILNKTSRDEVVLHQRRLWTRASASCLCLLKS